MQKLISNDYIIFIKNGSITLMNKENKMPYTLCSLAPSLHSNLNGLGCDERAEKIKEWILTKNWFMLNFNLIEQFIREDVLLENA